MARMSRQLDRAMAQAFVQCEDVGRLDARALHRLVEEELGSSTFLPSGTVQRDPRSGELVLYNPARVGRPHDNREPTAAKDRAPAVEPCVICDAKLTGIVDICELSEGFTFVTKNLYPILFPRAGHGGAQSEEAGEGARGSHYVQWSSSFHGRDWHNMPLADCETLVERLAVLEASLLRGGTLSDAANARWGDDEANSGFVGIVKNFGRLVGGSLAHPHQQIALCSKMPKRYADNLAFAEAHGEVFSHFLLRENPPELQLHDYGVARLLVPYFMRRPFDMVLAVTRTSCRYLHQLDAAERLAVACGWRDGIRLVRAAMAELGLELAFNVVTHNGPGAGLYMEFLPYTQPWGGYEQIGLILCQADPLRVAERARELLARSPASP